VIKSRTLFAALAIVCSMAGTASATPIAYTFNATGGNAAFVSLTGGFTIDSSFFTPDGAGQVGAIFKTATATNVTAFDFVSVTQIGMTDYTQEFTIASLQVGSGAIFDSTTNPPSFLDGSGPDELETDSLNQDFILHLAGGSGGAEISVLGPYGIIAFGNFTATPVPPTGVPEPISLSLFGAGVVGAAAMRRRKKPKA